jgi:DNA-binding MarR family transcriptional regulator
VTDGQELAIALRAAYWAMHRRTNALLAPHGVTADQFVLLARLAQEDGVTQQELARRASTDANTIRPMLLLLQKRGLIERRSRASDRRALSVLLTSAGRRKFHIMLKATEACREQMLAAITHGAPRALSHNLQHLAHALQTPPARPPGPRPRSR